LTIDIKLSQPGNRPLDADVVVVDIFREMIKIPPAMKVWRVAVIDVLYDHRIFNSNSSVATKWKPIIKAVFDGDKTSFPDLLSKYTSYISSSITDHVLQAVLLRHPRPISLRIESMRCFCDR
jgi:hypothetical protein